MPIGTAVHERTFPLCESLNYREWSGYYAVSAYEAHHEHEYNAIRNAAALIDISPLFKYRLTGKDATRLVDRIVTRDLHEGRGRLGDLHAVVRRARQGHRRRHGLAPRRRTPTAGRRPIRACAGSTRTRSASTSRSRTSRSRSRRSRSRGRPPAGCCSAVAEADIENLKYFKVTLGQDRGRPRRHLADRLHGRSRLRDLDSVEGRGQGLGRADGEGQGRSTSTPRACSRSTSRASRPGCC